MRVQQRASPRPRVEKKEEEKKEKKKKKKEEEEEEEWGVDLQFCLRQSAEVTRASPAEGDEGSARSGSSGRHIDAAVEGETRAGPAAPAYLRPAGRAERLELTRRLNVGLTGAQTLVATRTIMIV
ncbi:hypothetical protein GN956_G18305 [Arapaima gigas]